ncbi:MAG: hypothetical protein GWM98_03945, partial [Nitrospinaceae bacterium]|nr:hypothetical protein [Nitrospinaceae bacterium]NIR53813.1 hypothetical protein [Nitrospinaceae bacterium]NIT81030.1 hypothetical protein [Nitrospinaceae bacterium]NIW04909.1 hypothetical protein [Nitrospinaceae bacterium]NIX33439.1 hypothetical protein [Nitrospinaceae bacterium]
ARETGNSPNTMVASAVGILGRKAVAKALEASRSLVELFQFTRLADPQADFDYSDQLLEAEKYHK